MRFRRLLLPVSILILVSGLVLFGITMVRETHTSRSASWYNGPAQTGEFGYGGATFPLRDNEQSIIGTTGIGDLIILTTPYHNFSDYVCHQLPVQQEAYGLTYPDCNHFGGGHFNVTILYSYLQTHQSQIAYSQTIVNQNITLGSVGYHPATPAEVTIILAYVGRGWVREYGYTSTTNTTLTYPLIGYTEHSGTLLTLPNISLGLIASGVTGLIAFVITRPKPEPPSGSLAYHGSTTQRCPSCGQESLFFADKCLHCGTDLREQASRVELASH